MDIAVATDGMIYAADGISMAAVTADGSSKRVGLLFDGHFPGFVRGLAAGANGNLITTTSGGDVTTYHPQTHEMTEHAKGLNELYGVSLAAGGTILVAEGGEGRILAINGTDVKVKGSGLVASDGDRECGGRFLLRQREPARDA